MGAQLMSPTDGIARRTRGAIARAGQQAALKPPHTAPPPRSPPAAFASPSPSWYQQPVQPPAPPTDRDDPYAADILSVLRASTADPRTSRPALKNLQSSVVAARYDSVTWLLATANHNEFGHATRHIAVTLLDRLIDAEPYMSAYRIQLCAAGALFSAAKYNENQCTVEAAAILRKAPRDLYPRDLYLAEGMILQRTGFRLTVATPVCFLERFWLAAKQLNSHWPQCWPLPTRALELLQNTLRPHDFQNAHGRTPERVAAAALHLQVSDARLSQKDFERVTGFRRSDLSALAKELLRLEEVAKREEADATKNRKNPRAWPIVQKPAAPATTPTTVQPPAAPKMRFKVEGTWFRSWFGDVEDDPMEY